MPKKTYVELLKDPRWQKKRLEVLKRDKFCCQKCSDDKETLHVHHKLYIHGIKPWEYDKRQLITLCEECHNEETEYSKDHLSDDILILKEHFLSSQIGCLVTSLCYGQWSSLLSPDVFVTMVDHFFYSPKQKRILKLKKQYFKDLAKRNKQ